MDLISFRKQLQDALQNIYEENEITTYYFMLLEFYAGLSKVDVLVHPYEKLPDSVKNSLSVAVDQLKTHKPIQYILGETLFFSNRFFVNEDVLIPRQETEELVDWIILQADKTKKLQILDIGCGSGCIAISLAKALPNAQVSAVDISAKALQIAQKNAVINHATIDFIQKDILTTENLEGCFDIIVSNPPYVRNLEKEEIHKNVLQYEPHLALFVPDENPLLFYDKIADLARNALTQNGTLYFEINQYLGQQTTDLLLQKDFTAVELRNDLQNNPRMIRAEKS